MIQTIYNQFAISYSKNIHKHFLCRSVYESCRVYKIMRNVFGKYMYPDFLMISLLLGITKQGAQSLIANRYKQSVAVCTTDIASNM